MLASCSICAVFLEIALRIWAPLYPSPYEPDDELLVRIAPRAHKLFVRNGRDGGERIISHYNSLGFRGPEPRPRATQTRIIVYGDSSVQAEFSALTDTFAQQLLGELSSHRVPDPEVIAAGVVGYGPDQVSLRLADDIARLRPALAIVVLYADNDFGDLLRNRIYSLDTAGALVRHHPRLSTEDHAELDQASHPAGLRRLQIWRHLGRLRAVLSGGIDAEKRAREYDATYIDASLRRGEATYRDYLRGLPGDGVAENPFADMHDADIALTPDAPSGQLKVRLMEQVMLRMREIARASSTPLTFLILPSAIDVVDGYGIHVDAAKYPKYDRQRLSQALADICVRGGLQCLNLFPELRARDAGRYYFHSPDGHWNDAGQKFAAELMARFLLRQSLLPVSARP